MKQCNRKPASSICRSYQHEHNKSLTIRSPNVVIPASSSQTRPLQTLGHRFHHTGSSVTAQRTSYQRSYPLNAQISIQKWKRISTATFCLILN
ncbi:hypothetical protein BJX62DRAFT_205630 [Aspergillus germanicus]